MNGQDTEKCEQCKKMFDFDSDAAACSTICPSCMFDNAITAARADERRKCETTEMLRWNKLKKCKIEGCDFHAEFCRDHTSRAESEAYAKGKAERIPDDCVLMLKSELEVYCAMAKKDGIAKGQASLETGCKKHIAPSGSMVVCTACYNEEKENENPVRSKAFIEYIERKHSEEMRKRDAIILPKLDKLKPKQQLPLEYFEQLRIWWCHEARRQAYADSMMQYKLTTSTLSAETGKRFVKEYIKGMDK